MTVWQKRLLGGWFQLKKMNSRKWILKTLLMMGLFVFGVLLEAGIRTIQKEPIAVDVRNASEVDIKAFHKPDFLWAGTAWWIECESSVSFYLDIGSGEETLIPEGKHRIFSNHDMNNLSDYGLSAAGKFPKTIRIRKMNYW